MFQWSSSLFYNALQMFFWTSLFAIGALVQQVVSQMDSNNPRTVFQSRNAIEFLELAWALVDNGLIIPVWITLACYLVKLETNERKLRGAFRVVDSDGSGRVSKEEYLSALKRIDPAATEAAHKQTVEKQFATVDSNGDGQIAYADFVNSETVAFRRLECISWTLLFIYVVLSLMHITEFALGYCVETHHDEVSKKALDSFLDTCSVLEVTPYVLMDDAFCVWTWALAVYYIRACLRRWSKVEAAWWEQQCLGLSPAKA